VIDSHDLLNQEFDSQDIYFINGDPSDQLFGGAGGYLGKLYQNPDLLQTNIVKNKDCAIDFIATQFDIPDRHFSEWYYHVLLTNANSVGVSVTTLHDLLAWSEFNNGWTSSKFRFLFSGNWPNIKNAETYVKRFVNWYDSNHYQQWSMNGNNAGEKLGTTAAEYKIVAKKYIHSIDNNDYYFRFKTKMQSSSFVNRTCPEGYWCCIDSNWNLLNITDHRDQILRMLPAHLS
jgi:hypothetical protein